MDLLAVLQVAFGLRDIVDVCKSHFYPPDPCKFCPCEPVDCLVDATALTELSNQLSNSVQRIQNTSLCASVVELHEGLSKFHWNSGILGFVVGALFWFVIDIITILRAVWDYMISRLLHSLRRGPSQIATSNRLRLTHHAY